MRVFLGCLACAVYGWRVWDPKASYAAFFDAADWLTAFLLQGEGWVAVLRNVVNLILLDQADGFLLGVAFLALISAVLWPFRVCGRWCVARVRRLRQPRCEQPAEQAFMTEPTGAEVSASVGRREPVENRTGTEMNGPRPD